MRILCTAALLLGCASEITERPPRLDPTHPAAEEAPLPTTPAYTEDPLLALPAAPSPAPRPHHHGGHS